jgi:dimethylargininase
VSSFHADAIREARLTRRSLPARSGSVALTRAVSPAFARCELTHLARQPIDWRRATRQHARYERALAALGLLVQRLPPAPVCPDAVFVEDTAVVLDEVAVIARPGAPSRRPETATVARALAAYRPVRRITAPGTLDGGDVLQVGRRVFVGASARSNAAGRGQLRALLARYGYRVIDVPVTGCLHLKSAVTVVADRTLLFQRAWVEADAFRGLELIDVDPAEPFAANALRVGDTVLLPTAHRKTRRRLEVRGLVVRGVDVSELAKAEGGVTCCSLVVSPGAMRWVGTHPRRRAAAR